MSSHRGAGVTAVTEKQPNSRKIKYGKRCHKINNTRYQINILAKGEPSDSWIQHPATRIQNESGTFMCAMWHVCTAVCVCVCVCALWGGCFGIK